MSIHNATRRSSISFLTFRDGGFYVLEDLNTSYLRAYAGRATELDSPKTTMGMLKTLLDTLNHAYIPGREPTPLDASITGISTYPAIAFVSKGENRPHLSWNNQRKSIGNSTPSTRNATHRELENTNGSGPERTLAL